MEENTTAFKHLINQKVVQTLAQEIRKAYPSFPHKEFCQLIPKLDGLELKARVLLVTAELRKFLPQEYPNALKIINQVIENESLSGFSLWPFSEFIGQFGLEYFDESMNAMYGLTQRFTAEFAIRPFFLKDHEQVLIYFRKWARDKNVHVRRWVSEGSRPLLPWGLRLTHFVEDPSEGLKLLEMLKYDEEIYVRKSVANHLNDISKNHPVKITKLLKLWIEECPPEHEKKMDFIKRQALRTLIKKGDAGALKLMGVAGKAQVKIVGFKTNKKSYRLGDKLEFEFELTSTCKNQQKIIVDYSIDFIKANGKKGSKVFKLKTLDLAPRASVRIKKTHSLRKITTMTYYAGLHHLALQVNGQVLDSLDWKFNL